MPVASAANFAQFGACLAVGLKTKNSKRKTVAIPSSLSAALGITEPAIFGVNLRLMTPFVCGMIGGAAGGMFGSWVKLGAKAYGVTGIPGYLTINNYLTYTILLAISGGVAFALTTMFWKEDPDDFDKPVVDLPAPEEVVITCDGAEVVAPINGEVVPASEIPDPMFSAETMGPTVGIVPAEGKTYAPFDGKVAMVFGTKHALGLQSNDGVEVLIHVGVDTVNMEGAGFETFVEQGDEITKGQLIQTFDIGEIKNAGYSETTAVIITNGFNFKEVKKITD